MPSNPPVQKLPRERPPCASTPSPTAYVPVTSSPQRRLRGIQASLGRSRSRVAIGRWTSVPDASVRCGSGLLARFTKSERRIYQYEMSIEKQFALLDRVSTQRARLERSFTSAMRELKQLQKERQARPNQPPGEPDVTVQAAKPAGPHPAYVMSERSEERRAEEE